MGPDCTHPTCPITYEEFNKVCSDCPHNAIVATLKHTGQDSKEACDCGGGCPRCDSRYPPDTIPEGEEVVTVHTCYAGGIKPGPMEDCLECNQLKKAPHETILEEAQRVCAGPRAADYGTYEESCGRIAKLATILLEKEITAKDVPKFMIALKLSRETNKHKRDNLVDIGGYILILQDLEEGLAPSKEGHDLEEGDK